MARNRSFAANEQPFEHDDSFRIDHSTTHGPVRGFAPTQTILSYSGSRPTPPHQQSYGTISQPHQQDDDSNTEQAHDGHRESNIDYKRTSRNSRKGRHTLLVGERSLAHDVDYATPDPTNGLVPTLNGLWRMITRFPFNDLSYLTAISFVSGCTLLVINAFLSVLPILKPSIQLPPKATIAQSTLTFIGCTLFLTSSFLSYLEAVNANKEGCFGWNAEQTAPSSSGETEELGLGITTRLVPDEDCDEQHTTHYAYDRKSQTHSSEEESNDNPQGSKHSGMRIVPTLHELRTSYIYDIGFIACTTLFLSSIIFWTTALASLIVTVIGTSTAPWIRVLQLIASLGFAVASAIFALETQDHWLVPAPNVLGWHVGFWNFVGILGFALFAGFALAADEGLQTGSSVHYFWGSWGFLIGSGIQWYESLDKHPVERKEHSS